MHGETTSGEIEGSEDLLASEQRVDQGDVGTQVGLVAYAAIAFGRETFDGFIEWDQDQALWGYAIGSRSGTAGAGIADVAVID
jgi:hypothetical protein